MPVNLMPLVSDFQKRLQKQRITIGVIGDVIEDIFENYRYERQSSEDPSTPVFVQENVNKYPGGAGNLAVNIRGIGGNVSLVSVTGSDVRSDDLLGVLAANEINTTFVQDVSRPTTIKRRIVSDNRGDSERRLKFTLARESRKPISDEIAEQVRGRIDRMDVDIAVVSDYARGMITRPVLSAVRDILIKKKGKRVLIDPHPNEKYTAEDLQDFYLIKPNNQEVKKLFRIPQDCASEKFRTELYRICRELKTRILVTKSERGMTLYEINETGEETKFKFPSLADAAKVVSVSGAGDTVMAVLVCALAVKMDITDAIRIASVGAAIVIAREGTAVLRMNELCEFALKYDKSIQGD
ncbi:MAG: PfkB family carbohydrate kinase [Patescibacteria group bacterium]